MNDQSLLLTNSDFGISIFKENPEQCDILTNRVFG